MTSNHSTPTDTILFIHGLWMTPRSWEKWMERYESRGYRVLAPSWPGLEGEVEALNADSTPLKQLNVDKIVDHYDGIIRGLDSPPIIMGHSLGGTIVQLLLARGLPAAGVGVAPGSVRGVPDLPLSTLRATRPAAGNPFNRGGASPLSAKQFHYAFANTLSREESDAIYNRYHVPAANRVLMEVALATLTRNKSVTVDFEADRAPMLSIAFEHDHIIPPKVARHNVEKYSKSPAVTEFKEFAGRPHFPGAPGWEEVADYALAWATEHAGARRAGADRRESIATA
jgi:pimeloyl-ACP methyl ester carboxylesterase